MSDRGHTSPRGANMSTCICDFFFETSHDWSIPGLEYRRFVIHELFGDPKAILGFSLGPSPGPGGIFCVRAESSSTLAARMRSFATTWFKRRPWTMAMPERGRIRLSPSSSAKTTYASKNRTKTGRRAMLPRRTSAEVL